MTRLEQIPDELKDHRLKWDRAIALLIQGHSKKKVAKELGVTSGAVSGWCKSPDFIEAYNERRAEAWQEVVNQIRSIGQLANSRSWELLNDADTPYAVQARLIASVWGVLPRWAELELINEKLDRVLSKMEDEK